MEDSHANQLFKTQKQLTLLNKKEKWQIYLGRKLLQIEYYVAVYF